MNFVDTNTKTLKNLFKLKPKYLNIIDLLLSEPAPINQSIEKNG